MVRNPFSPVPLRYLLQFSYIGTRYKGAQRLDARSVTNTDERTVQCTLETAIRQLRPLYPVKLMLASRTDAGVHALGNFALVELCHPEKRQIYAPSHITYTVNEYLRHKGHEINLLQTRIVPSSFNPLISAIARSYMYRFAFLRPDSHLNSARTPLFSHVPLSELNRSLPLRWPNIEKMQEAVELFKGEHDFTSFMTHNQSTQKAIEEKPERVIKDIDECYFRPSGHQGQSFECDPLGNHFEMWEFYVRGNSFLYNQVRRMVGALMSVGFGSLTPNDIKYMLDNPSREISRDPRYAAIAPPYGLYLVKVYYDEEDLKLRIDPDKFEWDDRI